MLGALDHTGNNLDCDFAVTAYRAICDHADRIMRTPPGERTERETYRLQNYFIGSNGPAIAKQKEVAAKLKELRTKLQALDKALPEVTQAYVMEDDPKPLKTHIALRGDYRRDG